MLSEFLLPDSIFLEEFFQIERVSDVTRDESYT